MAKKTKKTTKTSTQMVLSGNASAALDGLTDLLKTAKGKNGRKAVRNAIKVVKRADRTVAREIANAGKTNAKRERVLAQIAKLKAKLKA
jgi:hypothetical protein